MFCIMGMKNCTVEHARERNPNACNRCGFNLEEYNRRISDIRENGLRTVSEGIRGYKVKGGSMVPEDYVKRSDAIQAVGDIHPLDYNGRGTVERIKAIPAADVVEVVHASWVWNPDGMDWGIGAWVCGKCKSRPETWWNTVKESHPLRCSGSRYCGNCGAKMDGGQDE